MHDESIMMKVYIAGKVTGKPNYKEAFDEAQRMLEKCGIIALNPAVLPRGMTAGDYMRICFAMIDTADMVVFLPDYYESKGAMLENAYARYIGKAVMYMDIDGELQEEDPHADI